MEESRNSSTSGLPTTFQRGLQKNNSDGRQNTRRSTVRNGGLSGIELRDATGGTSNDRHPPLKMGQSTLGHQCAHHQRVEVDSIDSHTRIRPIDGRAATLRRLERMNVDALLFDVRARPCDSRIRARNLHATLKMFLSNRQCSWSRHLPSGAQAESITNSTDRIADRRICITKMLTTSCAQVSTVGVNGEPVLVEVRVLAEGAHDLLHLVAERRRHHENDRVQLRNDELALVADQTHCAIGLVNGLNPTTLATRMNVNAAIERMPRRVVDRRNRSPKRDTSRVFSELKAEFLVGSDRRNMSVAALSCTPPILSRRVGLVVQAPIPRATVSPFTNCDDFACVNCGGGVHSADRFLFQTRKLRYAYALKRISFRE